MAKKPEKPVSDWRVKIAEMRGTLIDRLVVLAASEDDAVALSAIKTLLEMDPDGKADPKTPPASLFEMTDTHVDMGKKGPH